MIENSQEDLLRRIELLEATVATLSAEISYLKIQRHTKRYPIIFDYPNPDSWEEGDPKPVIL